MRREFGLESIRHDPDSIVTVGSFDGVHAGHQAILTEVIRRARARDACSTLVTFEPHPRAVLTGTAVPLLTSVEEKARLLASMGLGRLIVIEFTRDFGRILPEDYVRDILWARVGMQGIIVGHDHGFGRGRKGTVNLLWSLGSRLGFSVDALPPALVGKRVVSSRAIRQLITEEGAVALAREMLLRPYALHARVVRGAGRGRSIGVPTANLDLIDMQKVIPRTGVYVVQAVIEGAVWGGMMNIGYRPTVGAATRRHLEVHLFDFCQDIYGKTLEILFHRRLRDEVKFPSIAALQAQLDQDARQSRLFLQEWKPSIRTIVPLD